MLYKKISMIENYKFEFSQNISVKICDCFEPRIHEFDQKAFGSVQEFNQYFDNWINEMAEIYSEDGLNLVEEIKNDDVNTLIDVLTSFERFGCSIEEYAGALCFYYDAVKCWKYLKEENRGYNFAIKQDVIEDNPITIEGRGSIKFSNLAIWFSSKAIIDHELEGRGASVFLMSKYGPHFLSDIILYSDEEITLKLLTNALKKPERDYELFFESILNGLRASVERESVFITDDLITQIAKRDKLRFQLNIGTIFTIVSSGGYQFAIEILTNNTSFKRIFDEQPLKILCEYYMARQATDIDIVRLLINKLVNTDFDKTVLYKHLDLLDNESLRPLLPKFTVEEQEVLSLYIQSPKFKRLTLQSYLLSKSISEFMQNGIWKEYFQNLTMKMIIEFSTRLNTKKKNEFKEMLGDFLLGEYKIAKSLKETRKLSEILEKIAFYYESNLIDERHLKKFQSVEINAYLMFNKFQNSAL